MFRIIATVSIVLALLSGTALNCCAGTIVSAGGVGNFTYSWASMNGTSPQWDTHAYIDNLEYNRYFYTDNQTYYSHINLASNYGGSVTWHYQTDNGTVFDDDVEITYNVNIFSTGAQGMWGWWSIDGDNYTQFARVGPGPENTASITTALKDSGYTGGQDLYINFHLNNTSGFGHYEHVQMFRQSSATGTTATPAYVVSGTVMNPIPEPSTIVLLTIGASCLAAYPRRRKQ